jgi:hypothetical protein
LTLTVQAPPAGTVAPTNFTAVLPAARVAPPASLSVPPQVVLNTASANVIAPGAVGNTSVKLAPTMSLPPTPPLAAGLVRVIVKALGPPGMTGLVAKALVIVAGVITNKVAVLLTAPAAAPVCVVTTPLLVLL